MGFGNRGGFRGRNSGFGGGGFRRRSFGPREMTKIKCSECGKEAEVPFKPRNDTPVYCRECYFKKKGITPREKPAKEDLEDSEESEEDEEKAPVKKRESEEESEEDLEDLSLIHI